ncbi:cysteine sulfinate desulfinase [Rahnella sp. BIGb0236]|uniref:cysteine desulfurase CsdA n=1 Tax=Rahnella sp. BIGb0236 TaxID=2485117 RepID=UPI001060CFFB|nr:cysteine desulfurase CsdA [Rahnella sp. BIGb0236]TDS88929.1 cysteine sulfinate desulfinase [Rahnella sp. BIGb0236]VTQ57971.1 NifS family cysteine desulfurase [Campylobacter jejuni]
MTDFNPADFRQQFPALSQGQCYLDSAATALKPQAVIDATLNFYSQEGATVHRSQHRAAQNLTETYEQARTLTAQWINAPRSEDIVWTRGTTESVNMVAQGWLRPRLQPGDEIIVSQAEHHANLIPWLIVAEQCQAQVITLPLDTDGVPDVQALPALLNSKTRLLALTQMSNVTGGMPDIARAIELAHANGTPVMIDGAQGVVHCPPDVQQLDIDFYAFSGHKLYGPTGIGVLYGKTALLESMAPWQGGGKMLTLASMTGFIPQAVPHRFEAGTPNIAGVIGMAAALTWLKEVDMPAAEAHAQRLATLAEQQLSALEGFRSFRCQNSSLLAFDIAGVHHSDLVALLAEQGIALRAGQHCAQPLMEALGISGTLRASFAPYNNEQDVTRLATAVHYALDLLAD